MLRDSIGTAVAVTAAKTEKAALTSFDGQVSLDETCMKARDP